MISDGSQLIQRDVSSTVDSPPTQQNPLVAPPVPIIDLSALYIKNALAANTSPNL